MGVQQLGTWLGYPIVIDDATPVATIEIKVEPLKQNHIPPAPGFWELASECGELIVGQIYMVPVLNGQPVIGDPHVDEDHFNYTSRHYHMDSRFMCLTDNNGHVADGAILEHRRSGSLGLPKLEPRMCISTEVTPWPSTQLFALSTMSLYADYGHCTVKNGVCPHKGMPIQNGVCTGHRLKWCPDGTSQHKPPYTLRIRGTSNVLVFENGWPSMKQIIIPITEPYQPGYLDSIWVDMEDAAGQVIASRQFPCLQLRIGEEFKIRFNEYDLKNNKY